MDQQALELLARVATEAESGKFLLTIPTVVDGNGRAEPIGEEVPVLLPGDEVVRLALRPISALFTGDRRAPSFSKGPTDEYLMFFAMIEGTVMNHCSVTGRVPSDQEFEQLYRHLKRRPDGQHADPVFSYMQAAVRLHMSTHDTSRDEFEAVVGRIALSAKHFSIGYTSHNYFEMTAPAFLGDPPATSGLVA